MRRIRHFTTRRRKLFSKSRPAQVTPLQAGIQMPLLQILLQQLKKEPLEPLLSMQNGKKMQDKRLKLQRLH